MSYLFINVLLFKGNDSYIFNLNFFKIDYILLQLRLK